MKNAIKILSIIYIPLLAISMLLYLVMGILFLSCANNPDIFLNMDIAPDQASFIFNLYGIFFIVMFVYLIPGLILDIVLLSKSSSTMDYSKTTWIALGVSTLIFGSSIPGIISIIYGAMKDEPKNHSQEVRFNEKQDDYIDPSDYDSSDRFYRKKKFAASSYLEVF